MVSSACIDFGYLTIVSDPSLPVGSRNGFIDDLTVHLNPVQFFMVQCCLDGPMELLEWLVLILKAKMRNPPGPVSISREHGGHEIRQVAGGLCVTHPTFGYLK